MDLVNEFVPPVRRRWIAGATRRLLKPEFDAEPDEADDEANHEAPESPELVAPVTKGDFFLPSLGERPYGFPGLSLNTRKVFLLTLYCSRTVLTR